MDTSFVLENFRVMNGNLERLVGENWVNTEDYADKKRIRVGNAMVNRDKIRQVLAENGDVLEEEAEKLAMKQAKALQRLQDTQRVERALVRKEVRRDNSSVALFEELMEMVPAAKTTKPANLALSSEGGTLICQISDIHLGTTIALPNNIVNTKVLSQRMFKFMEAAVKFGLRVGARRCIFALTGDLCTSNRRPGEVSTLEYNRAHAALNAFEIISGAINLVTSYIPVTNVVSVCANESRLPLFLEFDHKNMYENFDWIIDRMLKVHYNGAIKFGEFTNPVERMVNIDGVNMLLTHGLVKPKATPEAQIQYYKAKYPEMNYMIAGHIHRELVALGYSRSSGLPGANDYSTFSLGIPSSCPGQTFHLVQDGRVFSFPTDLTEVGPEFFQFTEPPTSEAIAIVREKL